MPQDATKNEVKRASGTTQVEVTCVGRSPLLMNAMSQAALLAMRDKSGKRGKASESPLTLREECMPKLHLSHVDGVDVPMIPTANIFACLKNAGRQVRLEGKKQVSTATGTVLPALMTIETMDPRLFHDEAEKESARWEVDIQKGTNPNGGEAVVLIRPRFDQWRFKVIITINLNEVGEGLIRKLFDVAGSAVGLGDFRPSRGGIYGRFVVGCWHEA